MEFISGKTFRSVTSAERLLIWRNQKMIGDFETVTLACGHSLNSYKGFGVCQKCWRKTCGQCMTLVDEFLLCPECLKKKRESA